jgi:hypothetical protein
MKTSLYDAVAQTRNVDALIIAEAHLALDRIGVARIDERELTLLERINSIPIRQYSVRPPPPFPTTVAAIAPTHADAPLETTRPAPLLDGDQFGGFERAPSDA